MKATSHINNAIIDTQFILWKKRRIFLVIMDYLEMDSNKTESTLEKQNNMGYKEFAILAKIPPFYRNWIRSLNQEKD